VTSGFTGKSAGWDVASVGQAVAGAAALASGIPIVGGA
jgi:hypothetical protein